MLHKTLTIAFGALLALGALTSAVAENAPKSPSSLIGTNIHYQSPYAQAIALVEDATLGHQKGVSAFSHPITGVYCLTIGGFATLNTAPLVSIEWGHSDGVVLFAQWNQANTTCGGGANVIEVRTYKGDTAGVGSPYQIPVLSDNVAFVVLVP
jgi:hypothetical protein